MTTTASEAKPAGTEVAAGSSSAKPQLGMTASGIPEAPFISDVVAHLGGADVDATPHLEHLAEVMQKYKVLEDKTFRKRQAMEEKIPDIKKTLAMVEYLQVKKERNESTQTHFELNDTLYAHAEIEPVDTVNLWLGANIMLAYPLDEAVELLKRNLSGAEKTLEAIMADMDFLRDQLTVCEVNTARLHNFDVKRRREIREKMEREGKFEA